MAISSNYLFTATMNVDAAKEALFNEVYDTEHVPALMEVPGVLSVARFQKQELKMIIGSEVRTILIESEPRYTALYELESPAVLTSAAWAKAVDGGRWPEQVRPYTKNRRHVLLKRI